jgi:hypothetical protein
MGFARLDADIRGLRSDMDRRFDKVDERFDKVDERFGRINDRFDTLNRNLLSFAVAIIVAMIGLHVF